MISLLVHGVWSIVALLVGIILIFAGIVFIGIIFFATIGYFIDQVRKLQTKKDVTGSFANYINLYHQWEAGKLKLKKDNPLYASFVDMYKSDQKISKEDDRNGKTENK